MVCDNLQLLEAFHIVHCGQKATIRAVGLPKLLLFSGLVLVLL